MVRLLLDDAAGSYHWIGRRLVRRVLPRDMLGATVAVIGEGAQPLRRRARTGGSYGSASGPRVLAGIGATALVSGIRMTWPGGRVETWDAIAVDRYTPRVEGGGR
jgi:hypothetical protein